MLPVDDAFDSFDQRTIGRIAHTEYSNRDKTCTATLDPSDMSYEALMKRLADTYREPKEAIPAGMRRAWCPWHKRWESRDQHKAEVRARRAARLKSRR
jgi:hypothetical protein